MQNKKIKAIVLGSLSVILFIATYVVISNKSDEKKQIANQQGLSQNKDASLEKETDLNLYKQALDEYDVNLCNKIKNESKKSECFSAIQNSTPTLEQAIALSQKGSYNFQEKDYGQRAEKIFQSILEKDKDNLNALLGMGYAYEIMQDYEKALSYYNKALALAPKNAAVYNRIGHMYDLSEGMEKAESFYKKSLELNPNFLNAKINLARVYLGQNKNKEAADILLEAYVSPDMNARTKAEVGYILFANAFDKGEYDLAKKYIDEAMAADNSLPIVWVGKGMSVFSEIKKLSSPEGTQKIFEESLGYFDKAAQIYPYQTAAYYWKGRIVLAAGDKASAESLFRTALEVIEKDITLMKDQRAMFKGEIEGYMAQAKVSIDYKKKSFMDNIFIQTAQAATCCSYWGYNSKGQWVNHNSCVTWCTTQAQVNNIYNELVALVNSSDPKHKAKVSGNTVTCNNGNSATYVPIDNPAPSCSPSWGAWGACSRTCGGGTQSRGDGCGGSQSQACNTQACIEDGACGTNVNTYAAATSNWPSSNTVDFCSEGAGVRGGGTPVFPNPGASVDWFCSGSSGGRDSDICTASREYYQCNGTFAHANSCLNDRANLTTPTNSILTDSCEGSRQCKYVCDASQGYQKQGQSCVCTPFCAAQTCIGQKCSDCGGSNQDGTKDCRNENWQEVSPN
ncbi:MAG: O-GlcNAc transferase [uncultured bacterium]|nr:MAG: O-GlcNAc transferase [uncultured bacterium]HCU70189.1 hypothetical protein [Candidatus Moranbacteria bacterium]